MGDGFYTSKDPTNSIKVLKEKTGDVEDGNNTASASSSTSFNVNIAH